MWPLLKNGDTISISKVTSVKRGDIITVRNPYNRILTHRVIREKELVTKGDNNVYPEKPLVGKSFVLLGKVDYVIKKEEKIYINHYSKVFYKYSTMEMSIFTLVSNIHGLKVLLYILRPLTYSIFIFIFKILLWKKY